jgi:HEPN domain-containing protein
MAEEVQARQPRAEAVAEERRRRKTDTGLDPSLSRFGVTADILDLDKYIYRAAEDRGMRLHQLTEADDYDFVTVKGEKASSAAAEGVVRYLAGTVDGKPVYSYLLRKLKKYADEDRAERARRVDAEIKSRLTETPDDAPDHSYTPGRTRR